MREQIHHGAGPGDDSQAQLSRPHELSYTRTVAPRSGWWLVKNVEQGTVLPSSRVPSGAPTHSCSLETSPRVVVCQWTRDPIGHVRVGQRTDRTTRDRTRTAPRGDRHRIDRGDMEQTHHHSRNVELRPPDARFKPA